jgi:hypothetical protein
MILVHHGYKACPRCGAIKTRKRFPVNSKKGGRRYRGGPCLLCKRQVVAEWREANPEAKREIDRKAHQRWIAKPDARARKNEYQRRYLKERRQRDPAWAAVMRQDARIRYRLRAERAGRVVRATRVRIDDRDRRIMLPSAPLVALLRRRPLIDELVWPTAARAARELLTDEPARVEFRRVDTILVALDVLPHDVYDPDECPELYA